MSGTTDYKQLIPFRAPIFKGEVRQDLRSLTGVGIGTRNVLCLNPVNSGGSSEPLLSELSAAGWECEIVRDLHEARDRMSSQHYRVGLAFFDDFREVQYAETRAFFSTADLTNWIALTPVHLIEQDHFRELIYLCFYAYHILPVDPTGLPITLEHAYGMASMASLHTADNSEKEAGELKEVCNNIAGPFEIVKAATCPALATDEKGRIITSNQIARRLFAYRGKHLTGKIFHDLIEIRDVFGNRISSETHAFAEMIRRGEPIQAFELDLRKVSGEVVRVSVSIVIVVHSKRNGYDVIYLLGQRTRGRRTSDVSEGQLHEQQTPHRGTLEAPCRRDSLRAMKLTSREFEVLRFLSEARSTHEISELLCVSRHTVRTHIQNILRKLSAHSKLEAVTLAYQQNLIG